MATPAEQALALERAKQADLPSDLEARASAQINAQIDAVGKELFRSRESLESNVTKLRSGLSTAQAQELGTKLGTTIEQKMNEGSFFAMTMALILAALLDGFDVLLIAADATVLSTLVKFGVKTVIWTAVIIIIRKELSFFKQGVYRIAIRIIIGPIIVEWIPFLTAIPTYTILMFDVIYRKRQDLRSLQGSLTEVRGMLKSLNTKSRQIQQS